MTLTHEDVQAFNKMFPDSAHEELNGATYIREHAITDRLDSIDPNWTWERLDIIQRGNQVIFTGRLTVKSVWRDGVGMATITTNNSGREVNEAEKSAATDALKRAARLFGIGRYLLDLGKGQKPQQNNPRPPKQNSAQQPPKVDTSTGEIEDPTQFVSTKLIVKLTQKGKPFLVFPNVDEPNHYATDFSRDRLRKAGYNVDGWDKPGEYVLNPAALVSGAVDDSGYLNVISIVQDMPI